MNTGARDSSLQRIEDFARGAGTTVRNVRVYQEKGILPPPVRRGRTALYGPGHRRRLALILRLLDRGYNFATIDELVTAERYGLTLTELLEAENTRAVRKPPGIRRRPSVHDAEAVAGFEIPEQLLEAGETVGLVSALGAEDEFFADDYMFDLFRELVRLGVDREGIERIGELMINGLAQSADAFEVVVELLRESGMDQSRIEDRVASLMPRANAAVRLIFQSAVTTLLTERHGFARP